jgi:hypothetical protein
VELIFILIALVPVTYLFINRDAMYQPRSRGRHALGACVWGVVYGVLVGLIVLPLGILVGLGVGVWAFLR